MDDFLHNYEVSGGKMKPSLRDSGPEKLESSYLSVDRGECLIVEDSDQGEHKDDDVYAVIQEKGERERWDVETVLSESYPTRMISSLNITQATYTNLENHPRLIMAREERKVPKILLDPRTGFPLVEGKPASRSNVSKSLPEKKAAGAS
jgi:protein LTV1